MGQNTQKDVNGVIWQAGPEQAKILEKPPELTLFGGSTTSGSGQHINAPKIITDADWDDCGDCR